MIYCSNLLNIVGMINDKLTYDISVPNTDIYALFSISQGGQARAPSVHYPNRPIHDIIIRHNISIDINMMICVSNGSKCYKPDSIYTANFELYTYSRIVDPTRSAILNEIARELLELYREKVI